MSLPAPLPFPVETLTVEPAPPAAWGIARAVGGFAALGLAAGLAGQLHALATSPAGLLTGVGVLLLTAPALVVGHQFLGLRATPGALLGALGDAWGRAGIAALGTAPAVAWLSATSDLGPSVGVAAVFGIGAFGLVRAWHNLAAAEVAAGGRAVAGHTLGMVWTGLAVLVALRLLYSLLA